VAGRAQDGRYNNQLTEAAFIGTVGLESQFAGIAPVHGAGESDLVLRNKNSGAFEVYDIAGTPLSEPPAWVQLAWIGSWAASPLIRPPITRATLANSYKPWQGSAAVQPTSRMPSPSGPIHPNSPS